MHVLRMLIKLASLVHKCSGEEHFLRSGTSLVEALESLRQVAQTPRAGRRSRCIPAPRVSLQKLSSSSRALQAILCPFAAALRRL